MNPNLNLFHIFFSSQTGKDNWSDQPQVEISDSLNVCFEVSTDMIVQLFCLTFCTLCNRCTGEKWKRTVSCWILSKLHMRWKEWRDTRSATTSGTQLSDWTGRVSSLFSKSWSYQHCLTFSALMSWPDWTVPPSATIENFNVVETLSDNAVIVYQTHKVNWRGFRSCWNLLHIWLLTFCSWFDSQIIANVCCVCRECGLPLRETCSICQPSGRSWQQTKMIPTRGWSATSLWTTTMPL